MVSRTNPYTPCSRVQPAVTLRVYRVGRQSPLDISDKVNEFVESKRTELPEGIESNGLAR